MKWNVDTKVECDVKKDWQKNGKQEAVYIVYITVDGVYGGI